jgi:glutaredoxin
MLELYQTEWCPASRRVRERLTELGLDYLVRQCRSSAKSD